MQHLRKGSKFGRVKNQRKALFKTMLGSLIMHEKIETTEAKAKALKGKIDKIISKAKKTGIADKKIAIVRSLQKELPLQSVKKLTGDFLGKLSKRSSGHTRVIKLGRRKSDGARMAVIEFVD